MFARESRLCVTQPAPIPSRLLSTNKQRIRIRYRRTLFRNGAPDLNTAAKYSVRAKKRNCYVRGRTRELESRVVARRDAAWGVMARRGAARRDAAMCFGLSRTRVRTRTNRVHGGSATSASVPTTEVGRGRCRFLFEYREQRQYRFVRRSYSPSRLPTLAHFHVSTLAHFCREYNSRFRSSGKSRSTGSKLVRIK